MKKSLLWLTPIADAALSPFVLLSAWLLKNVRRAGVQEMPLCKKALLSVGVFPIRNHYYEPQFDFRKEKRPFSQDRYLPGIDWNVSEQLETLQSFTFSHELAQTPVEKPDSFAFYIKNGSFGAGDAEYWYQLIRFKKPKRIFEIGSGNSTLMAINAICKNRDEDPNYTCEHICIEPYEMPWLESSGVSVMRNKVEDVDLGFFSRLQENDILFIDSSHVIRPQGDVLFEYLELLPTLIFSLTES